MTKEKRNGQAKETDEGEQDVGTDDEGNPIVYYISLVAGDEYGVPRNEYFTFDITSKMDLKDTDVKMLECHDLLNQYQTQNEGEVPKEITVYELVENFVKNHPRGCFFIDECPFLMQKRWDSRRKSI